MEIISCFEPKRAAYASSCATLTIEDILNSQRRTRRSVFSAGKDFSRTCARAAAAFSRLGPVMIQARIFIASVFLFLCAALCTVQILSYIQSFAVPLHLIDFDNTQSLILDGKMRNFALNSGNEEFDGNGNVSLPDSADAAALFKMPVTYTEYKVRSGDNISSVTKQFGLNNISTLIAVNDIDNVRLLRAGQTLKIPSMDGLPYTVKSGDSLAGIAQKYGVSMEEILDVNELSSGILHADDKLFIPGARLDSSMLKKALGELFAYPLAVSWRVSSPYGWRPDPFTGVRTFHTGIDLVVPHGTPIQAAMGGRVSTKGYSNTYGNHVIIDHDNGYQTLYAHMVSSTVKKGQYIQQGGRIGYAGNTGYSTGVHLHFSVYKNGKLINPAAVLKF